MSTLGIGLGCALAMAGLVAGCGSDDDGGAGPTEQGQQAGEAPELADVEQCLTGAGFDVERGSSLPEAAQEAMGIEDHLSILGSGELTGLGGITWYVDADTAVEADEAGAKVRTDDVARGVVGSATWDYAGAEEAAGAIEGCL